MKSPLLSSLTLWFYTCPVDSFQIHISISGLSSSAKTYISGCSEGQMQMSFLLRQFTASKVKLNYSYKLSLLYFFSISSSSYFKVWCHLTSCYLPASGTQLWPPASQVHTYPGQSPAFSWIIIHLPIHNDKSYPMLHVYASKNHTSGSLINIFSNYHFNMLLYYNMVSWLKKKGEDRIKND